MLEDIKNSFLDMLNLRSLLDIQMENSRRYWIYKSGVTEISMRYQFEGCQRRDHVQSHDKIGLPSYMKMWPRRPCRV